MADIPITPGAGETVATDEVNDRHFPKGKLAFGADGTATDVTSAVGYPVNLVQVAGGSPTVAVDTELPAAAALADAAANPTAPIVGGANLVYNGTTWDRARGDTSNGLDVDVTRVAGQYAIDAVAGASDLGFQALAVRDDALATLGPADGDYDRLRVDAVGSLWTRARIVRTVRAGIAAATSNSAGGTTNGTAVVHSTYPGALDGCWVIRIANGGTGPTVAAYAAVEVSSDAGSTWREIWRYTHTVTNSDARNVYFEPPPGVDPLPGHDLRQHRPGRDRRGVLARTRVCGHIRRDELRSSPWRGDPPQPGVQPRGVQAVAAPRFRGPSSRRAALPSAPGRPDGDRSGGPGCEITKGNPITVGRNPRGWTPGWGGPPLQGEERSSSLIPSSESLLPSGAAT